MGRTAGAAAAAVAGASAERLTVHARDRQLERLLLNLAQDRLELGLLQPLANRPLGAADRRGRLPAGRTLADELGGTALKGRRCRRSRHH